MSFPAHAARNAAGSAVNPYFVPGGFETRRTFDWIAAALVEWAAAAASAHPTTESVTTGSNGSWAPPPTAFRRRAYVRYEAVPVGIWNWTVCPPSIACFG